MTFFPWDEDEAAEAEAAEAAAMLVTPRTWASW